MFKKLAAILLMLTIASNAFLVFADSQTDIKVLLDGTELLFDVPPQIIHGRTMVPMRKIFESMGANVTWDDETKTIYAEKEDKTVTLQIDDTTLMVNDAKVVLDVPPMLIGARTLVPVRAVAESFQAKVEWNEPEQTVIITSTPPLQEDNPPSGGIHAIDLNQSTDFICNVGACINYRFDDVWNKTIGTGYTPYIRLIDKAYRGQTILLAPLYANFTLDEANDAKVVFTVTRIKPDGQKDVIGENIVAIDGRSAPKQIVKSMETLEYTLEGTDPLGTYTFIFESKDVMGDKTTTNTFHIEFVEYKYEQNAFKTSDEFIDFIVNYSRDSVPDRIIDAIVFAEKNDLITYPVILTALIEMTAKNPYLDRPLKEQLEKEFGKDRTPTLDILLNSVEDYVNQLQSHNPPTLTNVSVPNDIAGDIMLCGGCQGVYFASGSYAAARALVEAYGASQFSAEERLEYMVLSVEELMEQDVLFRAYCSYMLNNDDTLNDTVKSELAVLLN